VDGNPAAAEFYGYTREQLRTLHVWDINVLPPREILTRMREIGAGRLRMFHSPHRIACGDVRTVELRCGPVEVEHRTLVHCIVHDITDRVEAEMAVRASEGRLRLMLRRLPAFIWSTDLELRVTSAEGSAMEVLGVSRERVEGHALPALLEREPTSIISVDAHRRALSGESVHYEGRWRDTIFSCHVEPLRETDGRRVGVIGVAFDITGQKELEDQLQQARKMEAIGRLAGGVAHDFNNLLTAIRGSVEFLLDDTPESSPSRVDVLEISHAAERAAELTHQLLAFGRKQVLQPRPIDLNQTVRETERMLRRVIGEDVTLETDLADDLGVVEADPGQIGQVLMNLAINARDAMPSGGTLTIATRRAVLDERTERIAPNLPSGTRAVHLCVRDTGSGISREMQDHIFEPFFTTKGLGKGTGLGLATVYGIIKQSGGYLGVESAPGQGATFNIYLPEADGTVEVPRAARPARNRSGTGTILLVEDEPAVLTITQRMLERAGYRVLGAPTGDDAIRLAGEHAGEIDLLITDVVMPGMNGRALADRLEEVSPGLRVLFMSGYTDDTIVHHGVLQPGTEFIQKPFPPGALAQRVGAILADEG
jgi:two-component system, cell cycle sensor histidine kinase and response regulator CckA